MDNGSPALQAAYAAVDWAGTSLGPPTRWSDALRSAADLALHTRFPVALFWGPELVMVYNDAYVELIGDKHPRALGARAADVFPEVWDIVGPMFHTVRDRGEANWVENSRMLLQRHGFAEECFFTFSYSPVHGPDGAVEGVIDIATETTKQVQDRRRLALVARLNETIADLHTLDEVVSGAVGLLRTSPDDVPAVEVFVPGSATGVPAAFQALPGTDPPGDRDLAVVKTDLGRAAWLRLEPLADDAKPAVLAVSLHANLAADQAYLSFLTLIAGSVNQAIHRLRARQAELLSTSFEREMSESLQHGLLGPPVRCDGIDVAVRYHAAIEQAQVGGDWYDSFRRPNGQVVITVGDVSGHDRHAAAAMAQARSLLRGIAYSGGERPARTLYSLDQTILGLDTRILATAVVGVLDRTSERTTSFQWSSAGHLPPVMITADGRARALRTLPDLMLGVSPGAPRHDHRVELEPGSVVVCYTDGLVERRHRTIDESIAALIDLLGGQQHRSADQLCDLLLEAYTRSAEDDIVLLVIRTGPVTASADRPDLRSRRR